MTALSAAAQLNFPATPTAAAKPWPQPHATLLLAVSLALLTAHNHLGILLVQKNQPAEAVREFDAAIRIVPPNSTVLWGAFPSNSKPETSPRPLVTSRVPRQWLPRQSLIFGSAGPSKGGRISARPSQRTGLPCAWPRSSLWPAIVQIFCAASFRMETPRRPSIVPER